MDVVEGEIFVLDMTAIVYQYVQLNSVGEERIKSWYTCLSKTFPQAYAFGLQLTKSIGYGSFFEYWMWVCGDCSR